MGEIAVVGFPTLKKKKRVHYRGKGKVRETRKTNMKIESRTRIAGYQQVESVAGGGYCGM